MRLLNDDEVLATIESPEDILHDSNIGGNYADEEKKVDIDTSGPEVDVDIEAPKEEQVVETEQPKQETDTADQDKTFENERETKLKKKDR